DVLTKVEDQTIKAIADFRVVLWDKKPGDHIQVSTRRKRRFRSAEVRTSTIELAASSPIIGK
ncbi:MAG: hypothetical protein ABI824_05045, partial [Acidobacteriota bacterium]